jgi:hypothetical protein
MWTHRLTNLAVLLGATLAMASVGARTSLAAVELSELLVDGASFAVGENLVFDEFTFSSTNNMPSAGGLLVESYEDAFGNFGIRIVGGMSDAASGGPSTIDLGYRVSTLGGMGLLSAAVSAGNPVVFGEGSFTITESFSEFPTTLTIFDLEPGGTKLLDSADLPSALSSLNVQLSVVADATAGGATASFIDQTFTVGSDNVIPEPASLAIWFGTLMLFGVVPFVYRRHVGLVPQIARSRQATAR